MSCLNREANAAAHLAATAAAISLCQEAGEAGRPCKQRIQVQTRIETSDGGLKVLSNRTRCGHPVHQTGDQPGPRRRQLFEYVAEIGHAELGAELFEFALVAPLLLMLLIGIVWIGHAYNVYETITRAAREGARYAVLPSSVALGNAFADPLTASCSTNTNTYNNFVVPALRADGLDPQNVKSYCQKTQWLENTHPRQCGVSITFKYQVQLAIPFTSLNTTTIDIPASAQMRLENQPTAAAGGCQ